MFGRVGHAQAALAGPGTTKRDMAEPPFSTHPDDDLPRTIRREKDARRSAMTAASSHGGSYGNPPAARGSAYDLASGDGVTVTAFDIPFFRLTWFLIKCVLAAIPALILFGTLLYGLGQALKLFFPWLVKMQIVVTFAG